MIRKALLVTLGLAMGVAGLVATAALAITGGEIDTVHKNVGLVRFTTEDGRFRCSGTLISQTVVLTAGHCTEGPATNVYVSFDDTLQLDPLAPGITPEERAARAAHYITGTAYPDPGWTGKLSISKQHDQGVVVLDAPASSKWRHHARSASTGRLPGWEPGRVEERDVHALRLRRRHRQQEGADCDPRTADDHVVSEERPERGRRLPD